MNSFTGFLILKLFKKNDSIIKNELLLKEF